jgi:hypothetical protein
MIGDAIAIVAATILFAIAAIHVYWAFGGRWPGHDAESLARTVIGGPPGMRMAPPIASLAVAALLTVACALLVVHRGLLPIAAPHGVVRVGVFGVAAVLLARGTYGFFDERARPAIRGSRYARLNTTMYSPLCLAVGTLALVSALASS